MIYKIATKIRTSRTGRQYENTCKSCSSLICRHSEHSEEEFVCSIYPTMKNQMRCIEYDTSKGINAQQIILSEITGE